MLKRIFLTGFLLMALSTAALEAINKALAAVS